VLQTPGVKGVTESSFDPTHTKAETMDAMSKIFLASGALEPMVLMSRAFYVPGTNWAAPLVGLSPYVDVFGTKTAAAFVDASLFHCALPKHYNSVPPVSLPGRMRASVSPSTLRTQPGTEPLGCKIFNVMGIDGQMIPVSPGESPLACWV
jgi:hypothetical protein